MVSATFALRTDCSNVIGQYHWECEWKLEHFQYQNLAPLLTDSADTCRYLLIEINLVMLTLLAAAGPSTN